MPRGSGINVNLPPFYSKDTEGVVSSAIPSSERFKGKYQQEKNSGEWKLYFQLVLFTWYVVLIPWVPEAFHARFSVSFRSYKVTSRVFGLQPTKLLIASEKKPLVPRLYFWWLCGWNPVVGPFLQQWLDNTFTGFYLFQSIKNNLILFAILSWENVGYLCMIVTRDLDKNVYLYLFH